MKYQVLTYVFCLTILACSNTSKDSQILSESTLIKENILNQIDSGNIKINGVFPFGCINLTKLKYPKHWEGDLENYGQLKKPNAKEFEDFGDCFKSINSIKTISPPKVENLEYLKIGDNFKDIYPLDTMLQKSIDSCRYHLPNIGIYECYYTYQQATKPNSFEIYGNLLLVDPKSRNGKLLNIYFEGSGDQHTEFRYFFIDKDTINIFEGSCYDDGCSLDQTSKIIINQDKIKIQQFKK